MAVSYDQQIGQFNFGIPSTNGPYAQDASAAGPYADTSFVDYTKKLAILEGTPDSTTQASGMPVGQMGSSSATYVAGVSIDNNTLTLLAVAGLGYLLLCRR